MDDEPHNNNNNDSVEKKDSSGKTHEFPNSESERANKDLQKRKDLQKSKGLQKSEGLHKKISIQKKKGVNKKEFNKKLRSVRRSRNRLVVCFLTLPIYILAVYALLQNGRSIEGFMYIYMALYLSFGAHMAMKRCPNCNNQFYVKLVLLNLFTSHCVHCGQSYKSGK